MKKNALFVENIQDYYSQKVGIFIYGAISAGIIKFTIKKSGI
jgi:hypothetical protein